MLEKSAKPAATKEPVVVKKYANRRLYNTETSTYVTLEDLAAMVRSERDFVVYDAKSRADLTHSVLTQIIVEQESRPGGNPMLPIPFLRQLIRFYGKNIERMVPSYLQVSMDALAREQDHFSKQIATAFSGTPFDAYKEQTRKNMEMFEKAMAMFSPFSNPVSADGSNEGAAAQQPGAASAAPAADSQNSGAKSATSATSAQGKARDEEMAKMKTQLDDMQKMINKLSQGQDQNK